MNWAITQSGSSTANGGYWSNPPSGPVWVPASAPQSYTQGNTISTGARSQNEASVAEACTANDSFDTTFTLTWVGQGTAPANVTIKIAAYSDSVTPDDTRPLPPTSYSFDDGLGNVNAVNVNGEFGYRDSTFKTLTVSGGTATYSLSGSATLSTSSALSSRCQIESGATITIPADYIGVSSSADPSYYEGPNYTPTLNSTVLSGGSVIATGDTSVFVDGGGEIFGGTAFLATLLGPEYSTKDLKSLVWSVDSFSPLTIMEDAPTTGGTTGFLTSEQQISYSAFSGDLEAQIEYNNLISAGPNPLGQIFVSVTDPLLSQTVQYALRLHAPSENPSIAKTGMAEQDEFPGFDFQGVASPDGVIENAPGAQPLKIAVTLTSGGSWTEGLQISTSKLWALPINLSVSAARTEAWSTSVQQGPTTPLPGGACYVPFLYISASAQLQQWDNFGSQGYLGETYAPLVTKGGATVSWQLFSGGTPQGNRQAALAWISQNIGKGWVYLWN